MSASFACPCCGYLTLSEAYGCYEICPICFWEDDGVQLLSPTLGGGANAVSLYEAQQAFLKTGASEARFAPNVRAPLASDRHDPQWRLVNPDIDGDRRSPIENNLDYFKAAATLPTPYWKPA